MRRLTNGGESSRSPCSEIRQMGQFYFGEWSEPLGLDTSKPLNWTRSRGISISLSLTA